MPERTPLRPLPQSLTAHRAPRELVVDGDPVAAAGALELALAVGAGARELDVVTGVTVLDRAVRLVNFSTSLARCQVRAAVLSFYTR